MKHEDFLGQYMTIRDKEVDTINKVLSENFNGEYHFEEHPYVMATIPNTDSKLSSKVMAVKAPISMDCGILVLPEDYAECGYDDPIEIGYADIAFGDIDGILDNLPEPLRRYNFRWDGGDFPKRYEAFAFQCDANAMMAARKFKDKHHIDIISVIEKEDCGDGTFAERRVIVYK